MKRALILVAMFWLLPAPAAPASHDLDCTDPQDKTYTKATTPDLEARLEADFDPGANATVCLNAGTYSSPSDNRVLLDNLSHVTIRNTPGHGVRIMGQYRLNDSADFIWTYGVVLDGSSYPTTGEPTVFLVGDDNRFTRDTITNQYLRQTSCVHSNSSPFAERTIIEFSRIYDCGQDGEHDHSLYLGNGRDYSIHDNWVYEAAASILKTHPNGSGEVTHNVFSQGCMKDGVIPGSDCSTNVMFSQGADTLNVHDNTIAYPNLAVNSNRRNADDWSWGNGPNVHFDGNCVWSADGTARISLPSSITQVGNVTANPYFSNHFFYGWQSPAHALRNYDVPASSRCSGKEPAGKVGAPG